MLCRCAYWQMVLYGSLKTSLLSPLALRENVFSGIFDTISLLYPPRTKFRGVYRNHSVCPSVCPSVCADSCPAHNFFMVWHWLTIFGTWVYHHETMCRIHSWSRYDLELWPQAQINRIFDMFSCPAHNFFMVWHWLTIFGTWMYHYQTMCRVHSWSWFNVDLWPQGQI